MRGKEKGAAEEVGGAGSVVAGATDESGFTMPEMAAKLAGLGMQTALRDAKDGARLVECRLEGYVFVLMGYSPAGVVRSDSVRAGLMQISAAFSSAAHPRTELLALANGWNTTRLVGRASIDGDDDAVLEHVAVALDMSDAALTLLFSMWRTALHEFSATLETLSKARTLH